MTTLGVKSAVIFYGKFLIMAEAFNLLFCSKSVKFSGFLSIYTEKKVSYIFS